MKASPLRRQVLPALCSSPVMVGISGGCGILLGAMIGAFFRFPIAIGHATPPSTFPRGLMG